MLQRKLADLAHTCVEFVPREPLEMIPGSTTQMLRVVSEDNTLYEGAMRQIRVNAYERNPEARQRCIEYCDTNCVVCGINLAAKYGKAGDGFIHVHHLEQFSEIGREYQVGLW